MNIKKILSAACLGIVFLFLLSTDAQAAGNFTTDYKVIYNVKENGITHADLSITLTNTSAQYYASSYQMNLGFSDITNVVASDSAGTIKTNVIKAKDGYNVSLVFNKKALGLGSKLPFSLSFDTPSIAKHNGEIWEITIPGISNPSDFNDLTVSVNVPPSFGKAAVIKPETNNNVLTFNKSQLGKSGISIAFGTKQVYDFSLAYHLKNPNVYPIKTEIALPPSTNYQNIFVSSIDPKPNNVTVDKDGNWLAQFSLSPNSKKDVRVKGKAEVLIIPKPESLASQDVANYTKKTTYWQVDDPKIKELAHQLKTPDAIYQYVVKTLKYDFSRVTQEKTRLGAVNSLENPNSAVCLEFTDLFITLSRAAGIPAREIDGFAYTENSKLRPISLVKDVLHAWPEYYDAKKKTWIMVDPTWGSTTGGVDYFKMMDFDHFAFAVKGLDDSYPLPAGGYKYDNSKNTKDVTVTSNGSETDKSQHAQISNVFPSTQIAGLPIEGNMRIYNAGSSVIPVQPIYISSNKLTPKDLAFEMPEIPPYGYRDLDIEFNKTNFLTNSQDTITIRFGDQTTKQPVKIAPFFLTVWGLGGISFGILTIALLIIAGKSRRLRLHR